MQTSVPELVDLALNETGESEVDPSGGADLQFSDVALAGSDPKDIVKRVESEILTLGKHKMTAAAQAKNEAGESWYGFCRCAC